MIKIKEVFVKRHQTIKIELQNSISESDKYTFLIKKRVIFFFSIPIYSIEEIIKHNI